ncbi:MAG: branched-chain amino acid aminotransferase [Ignavibacteria bacterium]|nr:branched-chain amino acid aminotransferase [Ignavibacteria bacterium]
MTIPIDRNPNPNVDALAVEAGKVSNVHSDHMFIAEYAQGEWRKARVQAFRPIPLSPLALGLHYAQIVFEGMKAYRQVSGEVAVFRMERHHDRFNKSLVRMCMPTVSYELYSEAIRELLKTDKDWVPPGPEAAFYLRPFMIATEERMGLHESREFMFMVVGGPFKPIYTRPLKVKVEVEFSRAASGGVGAAKCAGNYAGAMYPTRLAHEQGFDQVIWTDSVNHTRVEESGTMNLGFVINGKVVTPALTDTILDGVTRISILQIAADLGYDVEERVITVQEILEGVRDGSVSEAFGMGTAASVAPIGMIAFGDEQIELSDTNQTVASQIKRQLNGIRYGELADPREWMYRIE